MVVPALTVVAFAGASSSSAVVIRYPSKSGQYFSNPNAMTFQFCKTGKNLRRDDRVVDIHVRLPVRAPAIVNATPLAISTPLMMGDTRSL
jgi:hypothetical protein